MRKLGHDHFSEVLKLNLKGSPGANFPFHAHGDASLEMQMIGSSRYFFPNQDPVSLYDVNPMSRPHTFVHHFLSHFPAQNACMQSNQDG